MVINTKYLGILVTDNLTDTTFHRRIMLNLSGATRNTTFDTQRTNYINKNYNTDSWVEAKNLPNYQNDIFGIDFTDIYYNKIVPFQNSSQWTRQARLLLCDYTFTVLKSTNATYRLCGRLIVGNSPDSRTGATIQFYFCNVNEPNPLTITTPSFYIAGSYGKNIELSYPLWQYALHPFYSPEFSKIVVSFTKVTKNGVSTVNPSFEVAATTTENTNNVHLGDSYYCVSNYAPFILADYSEDTTQPYPDGEDEGGAGQGQTDEGDTPDTQTDNVDDNVNEFLQNGFIIPYVVNQSTLDALGSILWTDSIAAQFVNKGLKFTDGVLDLFMLPTSWESTTGSVLNICGVNMNLVTRKAQNMFKYVDLGTIQVPTKYGSFIDYRGYSAIQIYLPCLGFKTLNTNNYMGKSINVEYKICVLDGSFIVNISSIENGVKKVLDTFNGNCALHMPISSGYASTMSMQQIQTYLPITLARRAFGVDNPDIHNNGSLQGTSAYLGTMTPYILIDTPKMQVPNALPSTKGYMSHCMAKLQDLQGYTEVKEIHIDVKGMTEEEKKEIITILQDGVIL